MKPDPAIYRATLEQLGDVAPGPRRVRRRPARLLRRRDGDRARRASHPAEERGRPGRPARPSGRDRPGVAPVTSSRERHDPTDRPAKYPRKLYEKELDRLQVELVKMEEWGASTGMRLVVIFEGRDAAGKGGAIKRMTEHMNPGSPGTSRCRSRPNARRPSGTSSGTSNSSPPPARSCCSTGVGTTAPASSASSASARPPSTTGSCSSARSSSGCSSTTASS